jgi:DNA-binding PadR family transcriptional regulator
VANEFRNDRGIGAILSVGRPLVYRSFRTLEERGLIEQQRVEPGLRGPHRTVFQPTPRGRRELDAWLGEAVEPSDDMQVLILLKLVLADRAGIEPAPVVEPQKAALEQAIESLQADLAGRGIDRTIAALRLETAGAMLRFLGDLAVARPAEWPRLVLSA